MPFLNHCDNLTVRVFTANKGSDSKTERDCVEWRRTFASQNWNQWSVTIQSSNPLSKTRVTSREEIFLPWQLQDREVAKLHKNMTVKGKPPWKLNNGSGVLGYPISNLASQNIYFIYLYLTSYRKDLRWIC